MEHRVIIFDPPMCCSSGLCGPNPNQVLIELDQQILEMRKNGILVERHIITQSPEIFKQNLKVIHLIQKYQLKVLPITMVDGKIVKTHAYPDKNEWEKFLILPPHP